VTGTGVNVGGLIGELEFGIITNSYYDSTTSGMSDEGKGEGLSTEDMQIQANFTDCKA
jgi:hypothetical protein